MEANVKLYLETGDNKYFTKIYNELYKPILNFIKQKVYDNDTAHEILSLAFEQIYLGLKNGKYEPQKNVKFSTWAHACALNATRYYLRYYSKTKCFNEFHDAGYVQENHEEQFAETERQSNQVISYINNKLTNDNNLRIIAQRFFLDGDKMKDIAEDLGYNLNNIKYRIGKIRKELRSNLA